MVRALPSPAAGSKLMRKLFSFPDNLRMLPCIVGSCLAALPPAPVYPAGAPVYPAGAPVYSAGAPVYPAGAPVYSAGAPVYSAGAPVYSAGAPAARRLLNPSSARSRLAAGAPAEGCAAVVASVAGSADSPFLNFDADADIDRLNTEMTKAFQQGKYDQALNLSRQIVNLALADYGAEHTEYARALNNLAWHEQNHGDLSAARQHYEQALAIYESALGKDSPRLVPVINNLAILLAAQGDPYRAEPYMERALKLEEVVVGVDSPDLASTLNNLAVIQEAAGRSEPSLQTLERAYRVHNAAGKKADPVEKALTLSNLSMSYKSRGDLVRSEALMKEALDLREKTLAAGDPDLAETLNNLAMIELSAREPEPARRHFEKALAVAESGLPPDHIELSSILNNMVILELGQSNFERARQLCLRSSAIVDRHIGNVLPGLSFAEQRSFLNTRLPAQTSLLISTTRSDADASVSYNYLFRWKGLLIDSLRRQSFLTSLVRDPVAGAQVEKLVLLRSQLTALFQLAGKMNFEEWKAKSDELLLAKESLERSLSAGFKTGSLRDVLAGITLGQFACLLKPDELIVDLHYYRRFEKDGRPAYAAFVLDSSGATKLVDLGGADLINSEIKLWLQHTVHRENNQVEQSSLKSRLAAINGLATAKAFVLPDSELNRLPLSIFLDKYMIAQLDAPRELAYLRMLAPEQGGKEPVFLGVGGVDFGRGQEGLSFGALPGTLVEVQKLSGLAAAAGMATVVLSGPEATKERVLLELPRSQVVHFATHGVFSETGFAGRSYDLKSNNAGLKAAISINSRDPLARSGIVLGESQILSAEELVGCDLRRCRSIVLSACQTGLGDKENGQGVLGLRAAIMAAGARTLLISLWRVQDYPTALFMEEFYRNIWLKKLAASEAVKQAQITVAQKEFFKNTAEWGAWVLVGEGW
jgi:CHAT domain-containing protein/tetratricopeptide (TPR) repeat protein